MAKVSTNELKGRKFGRVLVKLGKVTREQVHEALAVNRKIEFQHAISTDCAMVDLYRGRKVRDGARNEGGGGVQQT